MRLAHSSIAVFAGEEAQWELRNPRSIHEPGSCGPYAHIVDNLNIMNRI